MRKSPNCQTREASLAAGLPSDLQAPAFPIKAHPWGKIAQKLRVPFGTLLGILFLLLMHPSRHSLWLGGAIVLLGALLRVWAAGHIEKGKLLARGGPYARTRNPLYLGSLLMALGVLIGGQGYWLLIPFAVFFLTIYYPVMKAEEQELLHGHGEEFVGYCRGVPLLFPGRKRVWSGSSEFQWHRVINNREQRTLLGLVVVEIFLIARYLL